MGFEFNVHLMYLDLNNIDQKAFLLYIQVKEHRAFTLETMSRHATSTELLQEIRQMMTQLKSYLLQSAELQAMLELQHQYAQDKLGNSTAHVLYGKLVRTA